MAVQALILGWFVLLIGLGIFHTWQTASPQIAFRWGCAICIANLLATLFGPEFIRQFASTPEQLTFANNTFLIAAGIGANMIAGSAFMAHKQQPCVCQGNSSGANAPPDGTRDAA